MKISLCLICQDEEKTIKNAVIPCIPYIDECIIVDGGSKDNTVEIARSLPKARVFEHPFERHFANQKNFALSKATGDWLLWIDCDEFFEKDLLEALKRLVELNCDAFAFPRKTRIDGHLYNIVEHDYQIRFWKNNNGVQFVGRIHESPVGFKSLMKCNLWIEHNKTQEQQQKDNELYWRMGQNMPEGWHYDKVNDKFYFRKEG